MDYKNIKKPIFRIALFKLGAVSTNFFLTSLLISVLGYNTYGIYSAIFALLTWFFLFDFGLAKGMRNLLTKAIVDKDYILSKKILSTTLIASFTISLSLILVLSNTYSILNLSEFLNIEKSHSNVDFNRVILIFGYTMFLKLFFSTLDQVFYVIHRSYLNMLIVLSINIIYLIIVYFADYGQINLIKIAISYLISVLIVYIIFFVWFIKEYKNIRPSFLLFSFKIVKKIFNSGSKILLTQLMFFVYLAFDRFIILKYSSPDIVSNFDIIYKVMSLVLVPWAIVSKPLWSSYSEAQSRNDIKWIKTTYKKTILFFLFIIASVIVISVFFDFITNLWISEILNVELTELWMVGLLICMIMWCNLHYDLLFGLSLYKISLISALIGAIIKIVATLVIIKLDIVNVFYVALTSILAYTLYNVVSPIIVKNKFKNI